MKLILTAEPFKCSTLILLRIYNGERLLQVTSTCIFNHSWFTKTLTISVLFCKLCVAFSSTWWDCHWTFAGTVGWLKQIIPRTYFNKFMSHVKFVPDCFHCMWELYIYIYIWLEKKGKYHCQCSQSIPILITVIHMISITTHLSNLPVPFPYIPYKRMDGGGGREGRSCFLLRNNDSNLV